MVLVGHSQRLAQPLTRRQRGAIALIAALVLAATLAIVLTSTGTPRAAAGCVSVVTASSTGGVTLERCGASARAWCREEAARTDAFALNLQAQCARAGLAPRRR
ncbi:MAG: hypothetical protein ACRDLP_00800 [Solirubrobacteraceae bacterium]